MIKNTIVRNVLRPLIERIGTMIAVYLVARGLDSDLVATMMNGAVAALFVAVDLIVSRLVREKEIGAAYMAGRFPDAQDRY